MISLDGRTIPSSIKKEMTLKDLIRELILICNSRYNCYVRSPANKTPEEDLEYAYQHISTFANTFIGKVFYICIAYYNTIIVSTGFVKDCLFPCFRDYIG